MAVEPQVQQFIDFIRDEMPRRIKTNPNNLPDAQKLLVSVSGTLEVIYKTLEELDIAIKSDVDTELTNKEPTITEGTSEQYFRGDKTWQTLNTGAVSETESRVYLNPEQKTVATQAASSSQSGYLTSTDWSTFNGKQAALADVITADTYGNSTQYPVITFNAKGIATAVTLQTVPLPTFTDATFSVQKNGSPSIKASWSLTALTASHVHTYPDKDIDFGDLPSVATNDTNSIALAALRCRILGGQGNTVSGTDNVVVASSNCTVADTGNTVIGGYQCNNNAKTGTVLRGRKAIAYTDFEQVDCTYFGTAHSGGTRQFYDRFAPNVRTYNTYMFGDTTNLSVQNGFSLAFKPKAVIGLSMTDEPAAAFHKIRIVALKMGGAAGAASMEVSLVCRSETVGIVPFTTNNYFIVERVDSAVVGTAGIMGTFTFSIDSNGYLIIQKSSQSSDWGYFIYGTAYHTAT